jgi:glyoxylase-like metal-dependent hydrolase (beta-lactamase superfamily II)
MTELRDEVFVSEGVLRNRTQRLPGIYAAHGHGDHWFGTDLLIQRFPGGDAHATKGTIALMHEQATDGRAQLWDNDFPGLIPDSAVVYQPIPTEGFELEGNRLVAVEAGHTDTDDTIVLHVPSIGLVVAGDVARLNLGPLRHGALGLLG